MTGGVFLNTHSMEATDAAHSGMSQGLATSHRRRRGLHGRGGLRNLGGTDAGRAYTSDNQRWPPRGCQPRHGHRRVRGREGASTWPGAGSRSSKRSRKFTIVCSSARPRPTSDAQCRSPLPGRRAGGPSGWEGPRRSCVYRSRGRGAAQYELPAAVLRSGCGEGRTAWTDAARATPHRS
jgi:hypothetical protein